MRIQHNITALNAHRNLTNNNSTVGKNLEKLSSGYRINRAGDDAAGLAISEKMRAQITGLQTAQKNAEDGVSLVQTAEGALTEVHSMLNRMVELATQSANGTYSDPNRDEMQKEIKQLREEINRISSTANFNGTYLFQVSGDADPDAAAPTIEGTGVVKNADGSFDLSALGVGDTVTIGGTEYTLEADDADAAKVDLNKLATAVADDGAYTVDVTDPAAVKITKVEDAPAGQADTATDEAITSSGTITGNATDGYDLSGLTDGDTITIGAHTFTKQTTINDVDSEFSTFDELKTLLETAGYEVTGTALTSVKVTTPAAGGTGGADGNNDVNGNNGADADAPKIGDQVTVDLHVGESASEDNKITITIDAMHCNTLGKTEKTKDANGNDTVKAIAGSTVADIDISTAKGAKEAIDIVNGAIDQVSSIRSSLGAMQNRLEHTINNLGVQTENITAAESRIRDVDMAKEMMNYTKNNILVQASQAMLAQANQVPQGVLQLLQ